MQFGEYELLAPIGQGGMADIFRARSSVGRTVVVKRIRPKIAADPNFRDMFVREAAISMRLDHGNIGQVFDFGEVDGQYFLAMEFIDGVSLQELIDTADEKLPYAIAVHVAAEVCGALAYAHALTDDQGREVNLVHRDVNPHNVMLSFEGAAKLVDFGIAKAADVRNLTRPGVARGKYLYFSPEQVRQAPLTAQSDVYAVGVVLYLLLGGQLPFDGELVDILHAIAQGAYTPLRDLDPALPPELCAVVEGAMATDVASRYADAASLGQDLSEWLRRTDPTFGAHDLAAYVQRVMNPRDRPGTTPTKTASNRRAGWWAAAGLGVALGVVVGLQFVPEPAPAPTPTVTPPRPAPPPPEPAPAPAEPTQPPARPTGLLHQVDDKRWTLALSPDIAFLDPADFRFEEVTLDPNERYLVSTRGRIRFGSFQEVYRRGVLYHGWKPDGRTQTGVIRPGPAVAFDGFTRMRFGLARLDTKYEDQTGKLAVRIAGRGASRERIVIDPVKNTARLLNFPGFVSKGLPRRETFRLEVGAVGDWGDVAPVVGHTSFSGNKVVIDVAFSVADVQPHLWGVAAPDAPSRVYTGRNLHLFIASPRPQDPTATVELKFTQQ